MNHVFQHHRNGFTWLLPFVLGAVVVELVWRLAVARKGYSIGGAGATLGVALGHAVFDGLSSVALTAIYGLAWRLAPAHWPLHDWRTWAAGFIVVEFAYYWFHRLSHEVRWMWATHSVHHTPEEITFLSAVRLGWTNLISGAWLLYVPVVLAGFDPRLVILILAVDLRYQFFLHTEARVNLGPLEWVLNTPAHHQVHHASNPAYLDKNYGGMVIVFDRLFGTFARAVPEHPPRYGLVHPIGSNNPVKLALWGWRELIADMWRTRAPLAAARIALGRPR